MNVENRNMHRSCILRDSSFIYYERETHSNNFIYGKKLHEFHIGDFRVGSRSANTHNRAFVIEFLERTEGTNTAPQFAFISSLE